MRIKAFLLFLSVLLVMVLNCPPSKALTPADITSEKYLIDHGHSKEIVRMINLQKERDEGKASPTSKSQGRAKKFLKNLWYEQDVTLPTKDFGYNDVKTVETEQFNLPKLPVKNLKFWHKNKDADDTFIIKEDIKNTQPESL